MSVIVTAVGRVKRAEIKAAAKDPSKSYGSIDIECQNGNYSDTVEVSVWGKATADVANLTIGDIIVVSGKGGARGWDYNGKIYSRQTVNTSGFVIVQKAPAKSSAPRV